jgi:hypothetical protein
LEPKVAGVALGDGLGIGVLIVSSQRWTDARGSSTARAWPPAGARVAMKRAVSVTA